MRHHSKLVLEYLDHGDLDSAKAYLKMYDTFLSENPLPQYCENIIVNAILRITARRCLSSGIKCHIKTEIPKSLPLKAPEVSTLFGNLLENSCEACEKCEKGYLLISAATRKGMLYVEIHNSVSGIVCFENDRPTTTKKSGGVGIASMDSILKKHGGMLTYRQEDDKFITQMIMPLQ